jgi:two-component system NarL family response regulator
MDATPIRVLCVDDHVVIREGIASILNRERDIEVVGSAASGEDSVTLFGSCRPDVTLMDLQLPKMSGVEAIRAIRRLNSSARIIVLTIYHGDEDIFSALEAGAALYLLKETLSGELVQAIREVHEGRRPLATEVKDSLPTRRRYEKLTRREVQVIRLVAQGMRNKEIAASLGIAEVTVQVHVKNVFAKLRVNDRTGAVNVALRCGIIHIA